MWHPRPSTVTAAFTLLALAGCASGGTSDPSGQTYGGVTLGILELAVTNDHDRSVRIYLIDGPAAIPLGSVSSHESRTFRVDLTRLRTSGTLRLAADPVGPAPRVHLPPVEVGVGQAVDFNLTNDLRFATFRVRRMATGTGIIMRGATTQ
jgi:hypothetical protein